MHVLQTRCRGVTRMLEHAYREVDLKGPSSSYLTFMLLASEMAEEANVMDRIPQQVGDMFDDTICFDGISGEIGEPSGPILVRASFTLSLRRLCMHGGVPRLAACERVFVRVHAQCRPCGCKRPWKVS